MKSSTLLIVLFFGYLGFSQNQKLGVILDQQTKQPLEFVNIYTTGDYTFSNADGRYFINSYADSIQFKLLGYEIKKLSFAQLKDTVYLKNQALELEGVTVSNLKTMFQKIRDSIKVNYQFKPYQENFFLRATLRRNGKLVRIQDMQGNLWRKTLLYNKEIQLTTKDYQVQLNHMRKVGMVKDTSNIYFIFPTFYGILTNFARIKAVEKAHNFKKIPFESGDRLRYEYASKNADTTKTEGHYIINLKNNAIEKFQLKQTITKDQNKAPYSNENWLKYKTLEHFVEVYFEPDTNTHLYTLKKAKQRQIVECIDTRTDKKTLFEAEFILSNYNPFNTKKFKKNVSATRDIFKLKKNYDAAFWKNQEYLLLTKEMEIFIMNMQAKAVEFKVKTNLD
ncbi:carboxypeptidase-like regulatory domain-containing protein [Flavobacterium sp. ASW18X]|uniref:carboxypeptidase-like regulatory domain-containing protein n=1 Tax=Flavobacterium sp. ASW18X TaxID=2572595 RepID=UPI0010AEE6F1|nr:carboxypeptidase-like regulatory domain-containing protein [Flavobacterium sp. ASW18X]TKD59230.1 carboxypeptidase-like regulatory domain-containing protein [Flavobacterium sp. ASW18X]